MIVYVSECLLYLLLSVYPFSVWAGVRFRNDPMPCCVIRFWWCPDASRITHDTHCAYRFPLDSHSGDVLRSGKRADTKKPSRKREGSSAETASLRGVFRYDVVPERTHVLRRLGAGGCKTARAFRRFKIRRPSYFHKM